MSIKKKSVKHVKPNLFHSKILKEKLDAATNSVWVNIFLMVLKLGAAIFTGSLGILAELIHSFFDLLASVFSYFGVKEASKPADEHHHYGHDRLENTSGLIQAALIALTCLFIFNEAFHKFVSKQYGVKSGIIGIIVMIITLIVDYFVSRSLHNTSNKTGSPALEANAYHFTTDLWGTLAVIVGLFLTMIGFPLGDVISAVVVALLMLYFAWQIGVKAIRVMSDKAPDFECIEEISNIIANYPGLKGFHSLRVREAGSKVFVDVCIHLDKNLTLKKAHEISERLELKILGVCSHVKEVIIHVEPNEEHYL